MMLLADAAATPPAQPLGAPEAVLYGLVQGVADFLPVSSSTHLTLLGRLLGAAGRQPLDEAYVMLFHLPTLAAACWVLRREIRALAGAQRGLLWPLLLASLVTAGLGYPLDRRFEDRRDDLAFLGCTLTVTGLVLLLVERLRPKPREGPWTWDRGIAVGLGQSLAGIPGLSRMGMSTAAGLLTGRAHVNAVVFSFLCAIPVTLGKLAKAVWAVQQAGEPGFWMHRVVQGAYPLGALIAFIAGVCAFRWVLGYLKRRTLVAFGVYCAIAGGLTLTWSRTATMMPPPAEPAVAPSARPPGGTNGDDPQARIPGVDPDGGPGAAADEPDLLRPEGSGRAPRTAP